MLSELAGAVASLAGRDGAAVHVRAHPARAAEVAASVEVRVQRSLTVPAGEAWVVDTSSIPWRVARVEIGEPKELV